MQYIVFDLEFNQDFSSIHLDKKKRQYPFEIIQIGAVKLDKDFNTISSFNQYIKPNIYSHVSAFITDLTGITTEQLLTAKSFSEVFNEYIEFIGECDSVLCVWGMADIKELFKSVQYYKLDRNFLPKMYINLQPHTSIYLGLPPTKLINLQSAVKSLEILMPYKFHSALHDAYYTAEILKKIITPNIKAKKYNPDYVAIRPKQSKKTIDYEKLLKQFEKMYDRKLSKEEQNMIILSYKMGKTHQFLK